MTVFRIKNEIEKYQLNSVDIHLKFLLFLFCIDMKQNTWKVYFNENYKNIRGIRYILCKMKWYC